MWEKYVLILFLESCIQIISFERQLKFQWAWTIVFRYCVMCSNVVLVFEGTFQFFNGGGTYLVFLLLFAHEIFQR